MTEEQALIDHIQEYLDSGMWQYEACYLNKNDLKVIIKALEQTRWIPVSERLPEEEGLYLVYTEEQPFVCSFEDGEFFIDEVLAWKPLPEPYKAESEEGK